MNYRQGLWRILLLLLFAAVFCWVTDFALNHHPTGIGHDYGLWLPRLLEGRVFFQAQGFAIPWYSPAFCGGAPFFPDPQSMFYSLPLLLALFFTPWTAIRESILLMLLDGFFGAYLRVSSSFGMCRAMSFIAIAYHASTHFSVSRKMS